MAARSTMRIVYGDSVVVGKSRESVGIVDGRDGSAVRIRFPNLGSSDMYLRDDVQHVSELIAEAIAKGSKYTNGFSYNGGSTLGELVGKFGYTADQRLRQDTLGKVSQQLERAGLSLEYDGSSRDANFWITKRTGAKQEIDAKPTASPKTRAALAVPDPFWPHALGLERSEELPFLRALVESEPILCLMSTSRAHPGWLVPTWEGLMAWSYVAAQRFLRFAGDEPARVLVRLPSSLQQYVKPTATGSDALALASEPRRMNLVAIDQNSEIRDLARLKALWPGPVFEFRPDRIDATESKGRSNRRQLTALLCMVGGRPDAIDLAADISPLRLLLWARRSQRQVIATATALVGELGSRDHVAKLRGSNESGLAMALKVITGASVRRGTPQCKLEFEKWGDEDDFRYDLVVRGVGSFEIETMLGSGPLEHFVHQKVFRRLSGKPNSPPFNVVVPADALLWAGPHLAQLAMQLEGRGRVMIPCMDPVEDGVPHLELVSIAGASLERYPLDVQSPADAADDESNGTAGEERPLMLADVAGYEPVCRLIADEVIWVRQNPAIAKAASRSGGMLFFGPPGCGKTRIARATCGELKQEVRLLGPADFKGLYIGWGQHLVREQFDWLFEDEDRVLVIDEFDAIARSRSTSQMHSDEKADVNELLVQLDRAGRLGRLVLCTTNFVQSLDEAVVRSGRFGHFVPVGPPDAEAARAVVAYYFNRLSLDAEGTKNTHLLVTTPSTDDVYDLITEAVNPSKQDGAFCCADLEDAVNRTFRSNAREAKKSLTEHRSGPLEVRITADDFRASLRSTRRSITRGSLSRFVADARTFCAPEFREEVERQLAAYELEE